MPKAEADRRLFEFVLRMGDNALILGQRNSEWCGHAPALEEDIAIANVALDLFGQASLWMSLAAEIEDKGRSADDLAFLREEREYRNCLLVEQPNTDFAYTLVRQFLFDAWHAPMLEALQSSSNKRVSEIAQKSFKEAAYHLQRSQDLVIRLGDGSEESHRRMQQALDHLWPFAGEMTHADAIEQRLAQDGVAPDLTQIDAARRDTILSALDSATLGVNQDAALRKGGKDGLHSEALGHMLSNMQYLQRAHPGAAW